MEYKKYSGNIKFNEAVKYVKRFHNMTKKYFIDKRSLGKAKRNIRQAYYRISFKAFCNPGNSFACCKR